MSSKVPERWEPLKPSGGRSRTRQSAGQPVKAPAPPRAKPGIDLANASLRRGRALLGPAATGPSPNVRHRQRHVGAEVPPLLETASSAASEQRGVHRPQAPEGAHESKDTYTLGNVTSVSSVHWGDGVRGGEEASGSSLGRSASGQRSALLQPKERQGMSREDRVASISAVGMPYVPWSISRAKAVWSPPASPTAGDVGAYVQQSHKGRRRPAQETSGKGFRPLDTGAGVLLHKAGVQVGELQVLAGGEAPVSAAPPPTSFEEEQGDSVASYHVRRARRLARQQARVADAVAGTWSGPSTLLQRLTPSHIAAIARGEAGDVTTQASKVFAWDGRQAGHSVLLPSAGGSSAVTIDVDAFLSQFVAEAGAFKSSSLFSESKLLEALTMSAHVMRDPPSMAAGRVPDLTRAEVEAELGAAADLAPLMQVRRAWAGAAQAATAAAQDATSSEWGGGAEPPPPSEFVTALSMVVMEGLAAGLDPFTEVLALCLQQVGAGLYHELEGVDVPAVTSQRLLLRDVAHALPGAGGTASTPELLSLQAATALGEGARQPLASLLNPADPAARRRFFLMTPFFSLSRSLYIDLHSLLRRGHATDVQRRQIAEEVSRRRSLFNSTLKHWQYGILSTCFRSWQLFVRRQKVQAPRARRFLRHTFSAPVQIRRYFFNRWAAWLFRRRKEGLQEGVDAARDSLDSLSADCAQLGDQASELEREVSKLQRLREYERVSAGYSHGAVSSLLTVLKSDNLASARAEAVGMASLAQAVVGVSSAWMHGVLRGDCPDMGASDEAWAGGELPPSAAVEGSMASRGAPRGGVLPSPTSSQPPPSPAGSTRSAGSPRASPSGLSSGSALEWAPTVHLPWKRRGTRPQGQRPPLHSDGIRTAAGNLVQGGVAREEAADAEDWVDAAGAMGTPLDVGSLCDQVAYAARCLGPGWIATPGADALAQAPSLVTTTAHGIRAYDVDAELGSTPVPAGEAGALAAAAEEEEEGGKEGDGRIPLHEDPLYPLSLGGLTVPPPPLRDYASLGSVRLALGDVLTGGRGVDMTPFGTDISARGRAARAAGAANKPPLLAAALADVLSQSGAAGPTKPGALLANASTSSLSGAKSAKAAAAAQKRLFDRGLAQLLGSTTTPVPIVDAWGPDAGFGMAAMRAWRLPPQVALPQPVHMLGAGPAPHLAMAHDPGAGRPEARWMSVFSHRVAQWAAGQGGPGLSDSPSAATSLVGSVSTPIGSEHTASHGRLRTSSAASLPPPGPLAACTLALYPPAIRTHILGSAPFGMPGSQLKSPLDMGSLVAAAASLSVPDAPSGTTSVSDLFASKHLRQQSSGGGSPPQRPRAGLSPARGEGGRPPPLRISSPTPGSTLPGAVSSPAPHGQPAPSTMASGVAALSTLPALGGGVLCGSVVHPASPPLPGAWMRGHHSRHAVLRQSSARFVAQFLNMASLRVLPMAYAGRILSRRTVRRRDPAQALDQPKAHVQGWTGSPLAQLRWFLAHAGDVPRTHGQMELVPTLALLQTQLSGLATLSGVLPDPTEHLASLLVAGATPSSVAADAKGGVGLAVLGLLGELWAASHEAVDPVLLSSTAVRAHLHSGGTAPPWAPGVLRVPSKAAAEHDPTSAALALGFKHGRHIMRRLLDVPVGDAQVADAARDATGSSLPATSAATGIADEVPRRDTSVASEGSSADAPVAGSFVPAALERWLTLCHSFLGPRLPEDLVSRATEVGRVPSSYSAGGAAAKSVAAERRAKAALAGGSAPTDPPAGAVGVSDAGLLEWAAGSLAALQAGALGIQDPHPPLQVLGPFAAAGWDGTQEARLRAALASAAGTARGGAPPALRDAVADPLDAGAALVALRASAPLRIAVASTALFSAMPAPGATTRGLPGRKTRYKFAAAAAAAALSVVLSQRGADQVGPGQSAAPTSTPPGTGPGGLRVDTRPASEVAAEELSKSASVASSAGGSSGEGHNLDGEGGTEEEEEEEEAVGDVGSGPVAGPSFLMLPDGVADGGACVATGPDFGLASASREMAGIVGWPLRTLVAAISPRPVAHGRAERRALWRLLQAWAWVRVSDTLLSAADAQRAALGYATSIQLSMDTVGDGDGPASTARIPLGPLGGPMCSAAQLLGALQDGVAAVFGEGVSAPAAQGAEGGGSWMDSARSRQSILVALASALRPESAADAQAAANSARFSAFLGEEGEGKTSTAGASPRSGRSARTPRHVRTPSSHRAGGTHARTPSRARLAAGGALAMGAGRRAGGEEGSEPSVVGTPGVSGAVGVEGGSGGDDGAASPAVSPRVGSVQVSGLSRLDRRITPASALRATLTLAEAAFLLPNNLAPADVHRKLLGEASGGAAEGEGLVLPCKGAMPPLPSGAVVNATLITPALSAAISKSGGRGAADAGGTGRSSTVRAPPRLQVAASALQGPAGVAGAEVSDDLPLAELPAEASFPTMLLATEHVRGEAEAGQFTYHSAVDQVQEDVWARLAVEASAAELGARVAASRKQRRAFSLGRGAAALAQHAASGGPAPPAPSSRGLSSKDYLFGCPAPTLDLSEEAAAALGASHGASAGFSLRVFSGVRRSRVEDLLAEFTARTLHAERLTGHGGVAEVLLPPLALNTSGAGGSGSGGGGDAGGRRRGLSVASGAAARGAGQGSGVSLPASPPPRGSSPSLPGLTGPALVIPRPDARALSIAKPFVASMGHELEALNGVLHSYAAVLRGVYRLYSDSSAGALMTEAEFMLFAREAELVAEGGDDGGGEQEEWEGPTPRPLSRREVHHIFTTVNREETRVPGGGLEQFAPSVEEASPRSTHSGAPSPLPRGDVASPAPQASLTPMPGDDSSDSEEGGEDDGAPPPSPAGEDSSGTEFDGEVDGENPLDELTPAEFVEAIVRLAAARYARLTSGLAAFHTAAAKQAAAQQASLADLLAPGSTSGSSSKRRLSGGSASLPLEPALPPTSLYSTAEGAPPPPVREVSFPGPRSSSGRRRSMVAAVTGGEGTPRASVASRDMLLSMSGRGALPAVEEDGDEGGGVEPMPAPPSPTRRGRRSSLALPRSRSPTRDMSERSSMSGPDAAPALLRTASGQLVGPANMMEAPPSLARCLVWVLEQHIIPNCGAGSPHPFRGQLARPSFRQVFVRHRHTTVAIFRFYCGLQRKDHDRALARWRAWALAKSQAAFVPQGPQGGDTAASDGKEAAEDAEPAPPMVGTPPPEDAWVSKTFLRFLRDYGLVGARLREGDAKRLFANVQDSERGMDDDTELIFSEFEEALAAMTAHWLRDPFVPLHRRLDRFIGTRLAGRPLGGESADEKVAV